MTCAIQKEVIQVIKRHVTQQEVISVITRQMCHSEGSHSSYNEIKSSHLNEMCYFRRSLSTIIKNKLTLEIITILFHYSINTSF